MKYGITRKVAMEYFEYDPYGEFPEWWTLLLHRKQAFQYKETKAKDAYGQVFDGTNWLNIKVGDKVCIDSARSLRVISCDDFPKLVMPIDSKNGAAASFMERVKDAVYAFKEGLRI